MKAEGRVPIKEFSTQGNPVEVKVGDSYEIYVERFENRNGEAILRLDKGEHQLRFDPAFKLAFPWFDSQRYWEDHVLALREQVAAMQEQPLEWRDF